MSTASEMLERIVTLEVQMESQLKATSELTEAVTNLTAVLEQGRGMKALIGFVILILPVASALIGIANWMKE